MKYDGLKNFFSIEDLDHRRKQRQEVSKGLNFEEFRSDGLV